MFNDKIILANYLNDLWKTTYQQSKGDVNNSVWNELYDIVFSENISMMIFNTYHDFNYYDTDTTYYEDVTAFIQAFDDYAKRS